MPQFSRWLAISVGFGCFFSVGSALAQGAPAGPSSLKPESGMQVDGTGATYTVQFVDDPLNALNDGVIIPRIVVRPGGLRTMLLRPRASYVNEMLKSVEAL